MKEQRNLLAMNGSVLGMRSHLRSLSNPWRKPEDKVSLRSGEPHCDDMTQGPRATSDMWIRTSTITAARSPGTRAPSSIISCFGRGDP